MKYATVPTKLQGRASFAVRVRGNSLEPIYRDGDLLLVEETSIPQHGDLCVFYQKGKGRSTWWLRRYKDKGGQRRLVSLSADIEPVPVTKEIICKGKVLGLSAK